MNTDNLTYTSPNNEDALTVLTAIVSPIFNSMLLNILTLYEETYFKDSDLASKDYKSGYAAAMFDFYHMIEDTQNALIGDNDADLKDTPEKSTPEVDQLTDTAPQTDDAATRSTITLDRDKMKENIAKIKTTKLKKPVPMPNPKIPTPIPVDPDPTIKDR